MSVVIALIWKVVRAVFNIVDIQQKMAIHTGIDRISIRPGGDVRGKLWWMVIVVIIDRVHLWWLTHMEKPVPIHILLSLSRAVSAQNTHTHNPPSMMFWLLLLYFELSYLSPIQTNNEVLSFNKIQSIYNVMMWRHTLQNKQDIFRWNEQSLLYLKHNSELRLLVYHNTFTVDRTIALIYIYLYIYAIFFVISRGFPIAWNFRYICVPSSRTHCSTASRSHNIYSKRKHKDDDAVLFYCGTKILYQKDFTVSNNDRISMAIVVSTISIYFIQY